MGGCGMYAYMATLEAIFARELDPQRKGRLVEVSLFSSLADWMTVPYTHYKADAKGPPCVGLRHPSVQPYAAYPTESGKPVLISIQNEREFKNFCCEVIGDASLAEDERFSSNVSRCNPTNLKDLDDII